MKDASTIDWAALRAPFNPNEVDFRIQRKGIALAYMDARLVQNRLDEVIGPENWSFDWTPLITKGDNIIAAKGTLTICGISKSDVGDAGQTEPTKATVSDAFKRAAVMWGIGRYLYDLGDFFCTVDQYNKIPNSEMNRMRAKLPRPNGYREPTPVEQKQEEVQQQTRTAQPSRPIQPPQKPSERQKSATVQTGADAMATERQITSIRKLCAALGRPEPDVKTLTFIAAREHLTSLSHAYSESRAAS